MMIQIIIILASIFIVDYYLIPLSLKSIDLHFRSLYKLEMVNNLIYYLLLFDFIIKIIITNSKICYQSSNYYYSIIFYILMY